MECPGFGWGVLLWKNNMDDDIIISVFIMLSIYVCKLDLEKLKYKEKKDGRKR